MNPQMHIEAQPELSTYADIAMNETDMLAARLCWLPALPLAAYI